MFILVAETAIAAGIRRIEAVTASAAVTLCQKRSGAMTLIAQHLNTTIETVPLKLKELLEKLEEQKIELRSYQEKLVKVEVQQLIARAVYVGSTAILLTEVNGGYASQLRNLVDRCKTYFPAAVIVLAVIEVTTIKFAIGVTSGLTRRYSAVTLARRLTEALDGKAGGKPELAQGSVKKVSLWNTVLEELKQQLLKAT